MLIETDVVVPEQQIPFALADGAMLREFPL